MIRCALVVAVFLAADVAPASAETYQETAERLAALPAELSKNKNTIQEMAQAMFGAALKRAPNNTEMEVALKHIATAKNREEGCRDLLWVIVNSKEFMKLHNITKLEEINEIGEIISKPKKKQ
jgi:hypothetical protein